ncbi:hypothetical protein BDQ17DRAFT_1542880 [Cyathus striatus]|nr:hypothetical protein BDQ17DRAFT_1542880 [Cyathus striatus]
MARTRINIPPDIVESIINEIDADDIRSLKACSLVRSDFSRASRAHLFRSITLDSSYAGSFNKYTRLHDALLSSPELSLYVREFHYSSSHSHQISDDLRFPSMLNMFPNITTFTLRYASWPKFTADLKQAFISIFLLPSLQQLHLCGICNMPISLAKCFSCIPSVTLSVFASFQSDHPDDKTVTVSRQLLTKPHDRFLKSITIGKFLDIEDVRPLVKELRPPFCKLEKLMIPDCSSAKDVVDIVPNLITKHGNTLTTLELPLAYDWEDVALSKLNISGLIHLHTIKLFADFRMEDSPLEFARGILSRACRDNEVKEIIIEYMPNTGTNGPAPTRPDNLDMLLTGPLFPNLLKVRFTLVTHVSGLAMNSWMRVWNARLKIEHIKKFLPMTYERGLILTIW